jgi:hypothetical protein
LRKLRVNDETTNRSLAAFAGSELEAIVASTLLCAEFYIPILAGVTTSWPVFPLCTGKN